MLSKKGFQTDDMSMANNAKTSYIYRIEGGV